MKRKQTFNRLERLIQKVPTGLFATGAVLILALMALWLESDNIHSLRDAVKVLFEHAESIAIVAAVVFFFKEAPSRKAQKHYEAWQVIDHAAAAKVPTSYARIQALQDLNEDGVSLRGLNLPRAHLQEINLQNAMLVNADLHDADLVRANLRAADLSRANLHGALLIDADLRGATLVDADLGSAILGIADLRGADLMDANLMEANLIDADLSKTNLQGANLSSADLSNADLRDARHLTPEQVKSARCWEKALYDKAFWRTLILVPGTPQSG